MRGNSAAVPIIPVTTYLDTPFLFSFLDILALKMPSLQFNFSSQSLRLRYIKYDEQD